MFDTRRRTVVTSLAMLCMASAIGCVPAGDRASSGADVPRQLTMATSPDYPPYEFYEVSGGSEEEGTQSEGSATEESDTIVGFDIDIATYIADELGYELTVRGMNFSDLMPTLQAGRVDFVMAGMTPTGKRKQNADFSMIYFAARNTLVSKSDVNLSATTELAGKRVGVQLGSIQESAANELREAEASLEVVPSTTTGEMIQALRAGRVDAAILEDTVAQKLVEVNPDLTFNIIPDDGPSGAAMAFPKDSELVEEFDRVLADMQSNGEMERLVLKWFSTDIATDATE